MSKCSRILLFYVGRATFNSISLKNSTSLPEPPDAHHSRHEIFPKTIPVQICCSPTPSDKPGESLIDACVFMTPCQRSLMRNWAGCQYDDTKYSRYEILQHLKATLLFLPPRIDRVFFVRETGRASTGGSKSDFRHVAGFDFTNYGIRGKPGVSQKWDCVVIKIF
jgi:hypothetical protein